MQAAQLRGGPVDRVPYGVVVRHVGGQGEGSPRSAAGIEVEHRDARAAREQQGRHGGPDPGRPARHQGGQSVEVLRTGHQSVSSGVRRACQTGPCG